MTSAVEFVVTAPMVERFGALTGDTSSLHRDPEFGRRSRYRANIVQGMLPVLFLSALRLGRRGHPSSLRSITGTFHAPVSAPARLRLTATGVGGEDLRTEIEYQVAFAGTGAIVTRGQAVLDEGWPRHALPPPAGEQSPAMPVGLLPERVLAFEEIGRGDRASFGFRVSDASLACLRTLVQEGTGSPPDAGDEPANLLATALYSTFVGMVVPGRQAIFTSFQSAFEGPIAPGRPYTFTGEVVFKSASTSTVVEAVSIRDELGSPCASGRIQALISRPSLPDHPSASAP